MYKEYQECYLIHVQLQEGSSFWYLTHFHYIAPSCCIITHNKQKPILKLYSNAEKKRNLETTRLVEQK